MMFYLKLIPHRSVTIKLITVIIVSLTLKVCARDKYRELEVIDDLLIKSDLEIYLSALEKIVEFTNAHKHFVDFNLSFGIFMIKANCKSILNLSSRSVVDVNRARFEWLVETSEEILNHFRDVLLNSDIISDKEEIDQLRKLVSLFFSNNTVWPVQLPKFHVKLLETTQFYSRRELEKIYYTWPKYVEMVNYDRLYGPVLTQSDSCLASLATNPVNKESKVVHCHVPYNCVDSMTNGADYGYAAPHRVVYFVLARLGRGCTIISPEDDNKTKDKLCAKMYNEAEYIALHGYKFPDLMLEIIGIASIEGHSQFLRRSWLEELIEFQNEIGCFGLNRPNEVNIKDNIFSNDGYQFGVDHRIKQYELPVEEICKAHITTVASLVLGSAIRFIAEMEKKIDTANKLLTLPPTATPMAYNTTPSYRHLIN